MIYKNRLIETIKYKVDAVTVSPLSIKEDEEKLKIDDVTGRFYIPGSSVAGAFRNYYENYIGNDENSKNVLFGGSDTGMNRLVCYDAFTTDETIKRMVANRPGLKIDRRRLTEYYFLSMNKRSGSKFRRHFVNDGIRFSFEFDLNNYDEDCDFNRLQEQFERLLSAFAAGDILLGNNKTVGFGRFEIKSVQKAAYNLRAYKDVMNYLLREEKYEDITGSILYSSSFSHNVRFKITGKTATPLLIKDEVIRLSGEPDGVNIKNGEGKYIIPGSSLKGVIRTRAEKIVKTFNLDGGIIADIFGAATDKDTEGHISRLVCYDTALNNRKTGLYYKIKIDYFTGGVQKSALMTEETVMGELEIECVFNTYGLKQYEKNIGLLLLVFRDLCTGSLNIGGGYAVGRGYIKAGRLEVTDGIKEEKMVYDFGNPDKAVEEKFNSYISKLMVG